MTLTTSNFFINFEPKRDAYGFTVRPQHLHRFREYADIYTEEEEERSEKWKIFLEQHVDSAQPRLPKEKNISPAHTEVTYQKTQPVSEVREEGDDSREEKTEILLEHSGEADYLTEWRREPVLEVGGEGDHSSAKTELVLGVSGEGDHSSGGKTELCLKVSGEGEYSSGGKAESLCDVSRGGDHPGGEETVSNVQTNCVPGKVSVASEAKRQKVQKWAQIRSSLCAIENMTSFRVRKIENMKVGRIATTQNHLPTIEEVRSSREESEEEFQEVFNDNETVDDGIHASGGRDAATDGVSSEPVFPWKEELEFLVHGGVPRDLRGEVWQAFVGVSARRVERYYQDLLVPDTDAGDSEEHDKLSLSNDNKRHNGHRVGAPEKYKKQIEKDLPRTFPGHPALDEDGRNSLRRLLIAYAQHNPSVGYCQAMNFFAGLLLLMMPEENAFWTLVGIIDDYFDGYFTEEMIESQVDQLVFEDLMRERFPKLVNHLAYLGVQVAWISGPWFLSIFVNMLPWESVLRVWDVLLFEGNRVMLFRTALALMELYGPAIVTTKDAGDAITLLQSLCGSTFDSSQLVLNACMGFLTVTEDRLQELRKKHRPTVIEAVEERSKGGRVWKDSKGLASKLYSFKHDRGSLIEETDTKSSGDKLADDNILQLESHPTNMDEYLSGLTDDSVIDTLPDLQEQVVWLKVELCRLLEEKRSATLRAEELEAALMEMVKEDNRRQLSAKVEQLEREVDVLQQALVDKKDQENAMLQVLIRVEQEQKVTEDARIFAEQDAAAQRYAVHMLQEKYDRAIASLAQMEKRVVMAESMLEATLQYESGQKGLSSPRNARVDASPIKKGLLSFGLGWRDRNKGKPTNATAHSESISTNEVQNTRTMPSE